MDTAEACRLARRSKCDCTICYYCDRQIDGRHEHDHFPVPKVARGTEVVTAFLDCHDLKDRYTLERGWPPEGYFFALKGLLQEVFAYLENGAPDLSFAEPLVDHPSLSDEAVLARWSDLPPLSRVLYGKMRRLHEEQLFRRRRRGQELSGLSALATAVQLGCRDWPVTAGAL